VVTALRDALAAENAAVFGYGVAGGRLTGAQWTAAQRGWAAHEAARDTLTSMLLARHVQPEPTSAVYGLPFPVPDARAAADLAAYLEDRVAQAYLALVGVGDAALRAVGASGLRNAALRAAAWRGSTLAFPGLEVAPTPKPAA
jgi:hypothetical protein